MSQTPENERFISFTRTPTEDGDVQMPALVINPKAIASIQMRDDGGGITITLLSGRAHHIEDPSRPRVRAIYRDLLSGLGGESTVSLPSQAVLSSGASA